MGRILMLNYRPQVPLKPYFLQDKIRLFVRNSLNQNIHFDYFLTFFQIEVYLGLLRLDSYQNRLTA